MNANALTNKFLTAALVGLGASLAGVQPAPMARTGRAPRRRARARAVKDRSVPKHFRAYAKRFASYGSARVGKKSNSPSRWFK